MNKLVNFDTNNNVIVILISEIIVSLKVTATTLILLEIPIHSLRPKTPGWLKSKRSLVQGEYGSQNPNG